MAADERQEEDKSKDTGQAQDANQSESYSDDSEKSNAQDDIDNFGKSNSIADSENRISTEPFSFKKALEPFFVRDNAPVTYTLIYINVFLFVAMAAATSGQSLLMPSIQILHEWGANFGQFSLQSQPWRILSQCFLHIGLLHLIINMIVLWDLGVLTERIFGSKYFFVIYFISGLAGSCVSLISNPGLTAAGASGAIFGVAGSLIVFFQVVKNSVEPMAYAKIKEFAIILILVSSVGGFFYSFDNGAHFGGLFAGALCGYLLAPQQISLVKNFRLLSVLLLSIMVVGLYQIARFAPFDSNGSYKILYGKMLLKSRKYEKAMQVADDYIKENPKKSYGYELKGDVFQLLNSNDKAVELYSKAINLNPKSVEHYASRAKSYLLSGYLAQSISDTDKAISLGSTSAELYHDRMMAFAGQGKYDKAIEWCRKVFKKKGNSRSSLLIDRAKIYQLAGKTGEAILDLDSVIEDDPNNLKAIEARIFAYYSQDKKALVRKELDRAEAISKISNSRDLLSRAYASLAFSRYKQAISDSQRILTEFKDEKENIIYGALVGRLAGQMIDDQFSVSKIEERVKELGVNYSWPYPIYRYLTGKVSESELYKLSGGSRNNITDVKAFLAFDYEINKQFDRAAKNYLWVVNQGNPICLEYELAKVRMSKIKEHQEPVK